jgi:hypothetical protein
VLFIGEALGINQSGQIAGFDLNLTPSQAYVLTPNHSARILPSSRGVNPPLPAASTIANGPPATLLPRNVAVVRSLGLRPTRSSTWVSAA